MFAAIITLAIVFWLVAAFLWFAFVCIGHKTIKELELGVFDYIVIAPMLVFLVVGVWILALIQKIK